MSAMTSTLCRPFPPIGAETHERETAIRATGYDRFRSTSPTDPARARRAARSIFIVTLSRWIFRALESDACPHGELIGALGFALEGRSNAEPNGRHVRAASA
jgi:hypothetical protein